MKINPNYGDKIITIPAGAVLEYLPSANESELKVLLYAFSNLNSTIEDIEKHTNLDKDEVENALLKWRDLGVFSCTGLRRKKTNSEKVFSKKSKNPENTDIGATDESKEAITPKYIMSSTPPQYSSDEINSFLEKNAFAKGVIDTCQTIMERSLNVAESSSIVTLLDYFRLTPEYILLACQHIADKKGTGFSVRLLEKEVADNFDKGISTYSQLEEHYKNEIKALSLEGQFKNLIGIGQRRLSKKEKALLENCVAWGYGFDIIELAFEITADRADKFNIGYMGAIISNWHDAGCLTIQDAEAAKSAYDEANVKKRLKHTKDHNKSSENSIQSGGSFDTDSFWERALENSYKD